MSRAAGLGELAAFLLEINIKCCEAFAGTQANEKCECFRELMLDVLQAFLELFAPFSFEDMLPASNHRKDQQQEL